MKQFICNDCGKMFDSSASLGGHRSSHSRFKGMMTKHKKLVECPNCSKLFDNENGKRKHCCQTCKVEHNAKLRYQRKCDDILKRLNVDYHLLEKYEKKITVCEICGKAEKTITCRSSIRANKLCYDHNHQTGNFRGLLCQSCNRNLGWFENNKDKIERYLELNNNFDYVLDKVR